MQKTNQSAEYMYGGSVSRLRSGSLRLCVLRYSPHVQLICNVFRGCVLFLSSFLLQGCPSGWRSDDDCADEGGQMAILHLGLGHHDARNSCKGHRITLDLDAKKEKKPKKAVFFHQNIVDCVLHRKSPPCVLFRPSQMVLSIAYTPSAQSGGLITTNTSRWVWAWLVLWAVLVSSQRSAGHFASPCSRTPREYSAGLSVSTTRNSLEPSLTCAPLHRH